MPSERPRPFPRGRRLRRRADFQRVYSRGVRVAGRHMVVFALATDGDGRFGVTASRKIGNAVARARCKRRLRELYRLHPSPSMAESIDLVVNARRSCVRAPWAELVRDYDDCLRRAAGRVRAGGR